MKGRFQRRRRAKHSEERGSVTIFVVLSLGALIGIAAWATETGRMWQAKNQLQAVADVASLAGVGSLLSNNFTTVDQAAARTAATSYGPEHNVLGDVLSISGTDVEAGSWDMETETFTPLPGSTDPDVVRAVRVRTRRDAIANGPIPTILGRAVGVDSVSVNSEAVAYWGFAGGGGPGVADLPVALDCCTLAGASCDQNYCDTVTAAIPNECALSYGGTATCLQFHRQGDQNACWTQFDSDSSSVNTADLVDIVGTGNTEEFGGDIYLDNGDKVPVISEIKDRFEGTGGYDPAEGIDTNGDDLVDSWVIGLPVVQCQNPGAGCATGTPQRIVGFVCFDIHEVIVTPDKIIKGSFMCSSDPRCDVAGLGPGGTLIGAISAQYPVIVD
jgi:hypothetical protein